MQYRFSRYGKLALQVPTLQTFLQSIRTRDGRNIWTRKQRRRI